MTWQSICADVLLVFGVGIELLSCLGLLVARNVYDRLHFVAPATAIGPALIAAAVVLDEALSTAGIKAVLVALVLLLTGPTLTHAMARASRVSSRGSWQAGVDEKVEEV